MEIGSFFKDMRRAGRVCSVTCLIVAPFIGVWSLLTGGALSLIDFLGAVIITSVIFAPLFCLPMIFLYSIGIGALRASDSLSFFTMLGIASISAPLSMYILYEFASKLGSPHDQSVVMIGFPIYVFLFVVVHFFILFQVEMVEFYKQRFQGKKNSASVSKGNNNA